MNKKYLNSALIVLLILIWGSVIYKYFGSDKVVGKNMDSSLIHSEFDYNKAIVKDTFELKLSDRDPFKLSKKINKPVRTSLLKKTVTQKKVKKTALWPKITYHGFVKSETNATRLVLIKIDNRLFRKRELEKINDLTILKAYHDSLIVQLNNERKTIKK